MKRILLSVIFLAFGISTMADQITGRLISKKSQDPIAFAQVYVNSGEEMLGTVSNEEGFFTLKGEGVIEGELFIQSLETGRIYYGQVTSSNGKNLALGSISLDLAVTELSQFEVRGDIGVTQIEPQKITYATSDLLSQTGGTAGDLLKNMPSVAMGGSPNHNRDIRFRGLGNGYTLVLINGRNVGINGNNRETVLDMIPASQIESIEILSQPGADVQGDGMNGVVNIILKKNAQLGTSGSAFISADNLGGYDANLIINQKSGRLQVMGSFEKLSRQADKTDSGFQTKLKDDGSINEIIPIEKFERKRFDNTTARLNLNYEAGKQWYLEGEYLYGNQVEDKDKTELNRTLDTNRLFKKGTYRDEIEDKNLAFHNAFFRAKKVWSNGAQLNLGLNTNFGEESKYKLREDFSLLADGSVDQSKTPKIQRENESILSNTLNPHVTLFKKFSKNLSFKGGYQGFIVSRESNRLVEDFKANENQWIIKGANQNQFSVSENTHALFLTSDILTGPWKFTLGYRQEITDLRSESITDTTFSGNTRYFLPLPNVKSSYTFSENEYLTASVGRRVRRPGYKDLNPFTEIKDLTEIKQGNPGLAPELAWAYELGYFKQTQRFNVGANVFYRDISNLIQENISTTDDGGILERPENLSSAYTYGYELLIGAKATNWWNINLNYSNFESKIRSTGAFEGDAIKDQFEWTAKAINDIRLPWEIDFQATANFVGPKASTQETENMLWFVDMGFSKTVAGKGQATIRVTDVFDTIKKVKTKNAGNTLEEKIENTPGQIISLGFKWNF
ncbi:MAG: TonB-dependent receptor [Cyclobacteriaceae bacterium]